MTPASPASPSEEHVGAALGPGRLLRAARESSGISLRDVAAQMHLDERTMVSLEKDAFDELPAPTFVRGYLRGYARLLGVPVGPVMEAYDREGFNPPDLVADIAEKPQAHSGDFPVRVTTYVVVGVLAALVVVWWNNQGFDEPARPLPAPTVDAGTPAGSPGAAMRPGAGSTPATPSLQRGAGSPSAPEPASATASLRPADAPQTRAGAPPPPAPAKPAPGASATAPQQVPASAAARRAEAAVSQAERVLERTRREVDEAARAGTPGPGAATQARDGTPVPAAAPGRSGTQDPAATQVPALTETASSATASASTPQSPSGGASSQPAPEPTPAQVPDEARVQLSFPEESWVEVYDREDRKLFYNLVKPGRDLDLRGPPPIRVLLGRARGVTLRFNGEPVDLAPHTDRGVARLTLGQ